MTGAGFGDRHGLRWAVCRGPAAHLVVVPVRWDAAFQAWRWAWGVTLRCPVCRAGLTLQAVRWYVATGAQL